MLGIHREPTPSDSSKIYEPYAAQKINGMHMPSTMPSLLHVFPRSPFACNKLQISICFSWIIAHVADTHICIYSFNKISALSLTKFHLVLRGFQNVHRGDIDILLKLKSGVVWRGQAKYSCAPTSYWPQPPCAPHLAAAACLLRRRAAARIAPRSRGWSSSWRSACADICRGLSHWCLSALCWGTDPPSVACHRYYR